MWSWNRCKNIYKKGIKVIGIDLSEKMIETSSKRAKRVKFYVMDMRKLKFKDNTFDGVWVSDSFFAFIKEGCFIGIERGL